MKVTKLLGLAAVAGLLALAAPAERALALSLQSPGAAATVQEGSQQASDMIEVRHGHHHHRWHRHHRGHRHHGWHHHHHRHHGHHHRHWRR